MKPSLHQMAAVVRRMLTTTMSAAATTTATPITTVSTTTPVLQSPQWKWWRRANLDILAQNAAKIMLPVQICRGISKHIVAWIPTMPKNVTCVVKCMFPCLHSLCTSWPTTSVTNVMFVEKPSPGPGCSKATWGHTAATNLMAAPTAVNASLTVPTFVPICKPIQLSRTSSANVATSRLHSSPT